MSLSFVQEGARTYLTTYADFGEVKRTTFLGLANAPVILLDDDTLVGIAGKPVLKDIVNIETKRNAEDELCNLPLDIRMIGIEVLDGMGVDKSIQAAMFSAWRTKLTAEQRNQFTANWEEVSSGTPQEKGAFVQRMVKTLSGGEAQA